MKKKKNKKAFKKIYLIPLSIIICIFLYLLVKCFFINYYKVDYKQIKKIISNLKIEDTITVNTKQLNEEDYLIFNEVKLKNVFDDFTLGENNGENFKEYFLYDENENIKATFMMTKYSPFITVLKKQDLALFTSDNKDKKKMKNMDISNYMKRINVNNDIDLLKYLQKPLLQENNIFTHIKDMKDKYCFYKLISISLPSSKSITLIEGDYNGYIFSNDNLKEVNILKNNYRYVFTFIKLDYFTDEYLKELLHTIVIEDL